MRVTEYGEGGFDPSKPNNNIVDEYEIQTEDVGETITIPLAARDDLALKLVDPSINSIAEIKAAFLEFIRSTY